MSKSNTLHAVAFRFEFGEHYRHARNVSCGSSTRYDIKLSKGEYKKQVNEGAASMRRRLVTALDSRRGAVVADHQRGNFNKSGHVSVIITQKKV